MTPTARSSFSGDFSAARIWGARAISAAAPLSRVGSSPTLPSISAAGRYGASGVERTSTSIAPEPAPIAVSILSTEWRPWRGLPAFISTFSDASSASSIRFWYSGGATPRNENSASRYSSDLSGDGSFIATS